VSARTPAKGHTAKHATSKHKSTSKHHPSKEKKTVTGRGARVHTVAKGAGHAKPRGCAVGDLLPVCSFEAVAMSLRLLGQPVPDDEVAWLWELCGSREVSIAEALDAFGRAGVVDELKVLPLAVQHCGELHALQGRQADGLDDVAVALLDRDAPFGAVLHDSHGGDVGRGDAASVLVHGLILGVDSPGPHAVLATPGGWWSWGQLYDPWPCRIEEAWAVSWT
jgi:hypothetical protein